LLFYSSELRTIDNDSSLSCARLAYIKALEIKNEQLQGEAIIQFALCDEMKGDYRACLKYYFMAANLFKKNKNNEGMSKCYTGMGITYWYQGLYNQAVDYFNRNIVISKKLNDNEGLATSYGNLAIIFDELGKLDSSLAYYNKALDIFKKGKNARQLASLYDNMSLIYLQKNDFINALSFHGKGFTIRKSLADTFGLMASMENLGTIYIRQKKADMALEISKEVLRLAQKFNAREDLKFAYINLRDAYELKGEYKAAFDVQSKLMRLKDSIRNQENLNQTAEMEAKFNNKEKEAELSEIKLEQKLIEQENENRNKKKNFLITILIISGISFLLIAFLIFKRFKEKQKIADELKTKNDAISAQKIIIDKAYSELAEINKDITDSIKYAKRIQEAIFPTQQLFNEILPESFVLFKPKDIVSGDFYWIDKIDNDIYIAVVDCTGHGVPGAFMSIVGFNLLNKAIHENKCRLPAEILNQVNYDLNETLKQSIEESQVKDGMEITLCRWNKKSNEFIFSSANHIMYQIKNDTLIMHRGDKQPIGAFYGEELKSFTNQVINIDKGDHFYLTSDGYADQFGGPKGKKFKYKQFEEKIMEIHDKPLPEQKEFLNKVFLGWKGNLEQIDDVLVFGIKI